MDLGVSETIGEETSHPQGKYGSTSAGKLDNIASDRELQTEGDVHTTYVAPEELRAVSNQLEENGFFVLPDYRKAENSGSHRDIVQSIPTESNYDQGDSQPPFRNGDVQGEMDELSGSHFHKSSFQFMTKTSLDERGTEDSTHSQETPLTVDDEQTEKMEGKSDQDKLKATPDEEETNIFEDKIGEPETEPKNRNYHLRNSPTATEGLEVERSYSHPNFSENSPRYSASPPRLQEMSDSPKRSLKLPQSPNGHGMLPSQEGAIEPTQPLASSTHLKTSHERSSKHRYKQSSPPQSPDQPSKVPIQDHLSTKQIAALPERTRHKDSSSRKRKPSSPKVHKSPRKYGRLERQVSRSPARLRDPSSRYQNDHRGRSPTRSSYMRDHHRSSRGRYSPSHRFSPGYHSPRHRPWVPPPNRRTGLGKPGNNLFVAGFSFLTTERDLERKFSRFGRVQDVRIVRDKRSGDSRGFGFLSLERDEDADAAIRGLDETKWNGRIILVEKSKSH